MTLRRKFRVVIFIFGECLIMATWLLTWNPNRWEWDRYEEECEKASKDYPLPFTWSCHSKKVKAGDEFYLMKLGKPPRGIIAHGTVTEDIFEAEHWNANRTEETITYLDGECDTLLNYKTQGILDVSVLDERLPQQYWHPQSSGIRIKDEVLPALHELWTETIRDYPANPEESVYDERIIEGAKKVVYTTTYERDPKVRRAFLRGKKLKCEACGFDFEKVYGKLGVGYIEVHHKKPVSEGERITDLESDLAMLCSNCHRMIHRGKDHMITVEELKRIIGSN